MAQEPPEMEEEAGRGEIFCDASVHNCEHVENNRLCHVTHSARASKVISDVLGVRRAKPHRDDLVRLAQFTSSGWP